MTETNVPRLRFKGFDGEWEERKISDIATIKAGGDVDNEKILMSGKYPVIANNLNNNGIIGYYNDSYNVDFPCVTVTARGTLGIPKSRNYKFVSVGRLLVMKSKLNIGFLENLIRTMRIYNESTGVPQLTGPQFGKYSIFYTKNTVEQQKIGSFFSKIDKIIELQTKKLDQLKKLKQGYLQKMFPQDGESVPRLRFSGFSGEWKEEELGRLLIHNSIRNKDGNITNVESVSNKVGFIKQTDQFDDYSVASKDLSNYFVISPGMFAYNPSRINVGSIAYKYKSQSISIVSPLYVSFKTNELIDDDFFLYWFKTEYFRQQREKYSEGGVRDTLSYKSLSKFKFMLPSLEEQKQIGSFISKLDQMINNQSDKINVLQQEKKSYLQKMFI